MKPMFILNRNEEIVAVLSGNADDSGCHFFNALLTVELNKGASLTFEVDTTESDVVKYVKEENMVIVHDGENHRLLVIKEVSDIHGDSSMKEVYCEDASSELIDEIIYNEITGKLEMREALASMLRNTRWQVGEVDNAYIRNLKSDYKLKTVLNGIQTLANDYDAEIDFTVEFAGNKIVSRKVHMKQAFGRTLGKRFEFGKDVTSIKRTVNTADIKTAIVPFGATNEETGEVLTIKDVEWSKPTNPFNKPLGQTYIEDEEATALWGYKGSGQTRRARWIAITFDDCTSANELINYAQLQLNRFNKPKISYEVEVVDLYRMMEDESYSYEKVCLGDLVNIIDHEFVPALALQSRIVKLELDLNDTSNSKVTLGTVVETIVDKDLKTQLEDLNKKVNAVASSIDFSDIEDRLDSLESETGTGKWEQIQEVNNLLFSNAVGYHYMDSSNGIWVFDKPVNEKPTKAVALKGGMIGLAKYDTQKQQWNVGTFIDGTSVNASMINTGTLKADRIEAGALSITHFNKELTNVINSVGTKASKTEVTAAIKTAVDEINLSVSTKYSTKSETSSVVANAKSEAVTSAVNTAKSYADTKKAEAITKAVEDASAYADTKANAVKTALTPLIDGKASKTDVYTKEETYTKGQTDSAIKVAKDEINLGVKNTYETKTNVENKITSASTSTLSSAKSYADTKKNEAINSASADATNKVNSAKNELNNTINNIKVGGRNLLSINNVVNRDSANFTKNKYSVTFTHNSEWQGIQFYNLVDIMELNQTYILQYKVRKTAGSLIGIAHHIDSQFSVITYTVDGVSRSAGTSVTDMGINDSNWHTCIMEVKRITNVAGDGTGTTNRIIPQPNRGLTTSVSVEMKDFQIEKGNKATDWTPSPEDIQSSLDLKASKTDVYTKTETYTKGETDSRIKIAKDEINLGVSTNYETKSNVESKITSATTSVLTSAKSYADTKKNEAVNTSKSYADTKKAEAINSASADATNKVNSAKNELNNTINNIKVGGRNLLKDSNFIVQATSSSPAPTKAVGLVNGLNLNETFLGKTVVFSYFIHCTGNRTNGSGSLGSRFGIHGSVLWKNSSTGATRIDYPFADCLTGSYTNTRVSMSYTFNPPSGYDSISSFTFAYQPLAKPSSDNAEVWKIGQPKLEIGTKATDWTPAPEDVQASIDLKASKTDVYTKSETYTKSQTDSAIKVAKDEINLGVQNKYETKTNVESKISTAKTEVIATSKSYADTKKSEAITQAGKDADSKVAGAKSELIGKIDLKANTTDVYKKSETYTKGETDSRIKVAKDEITLGVSNTYETKSNVESKINSATTSLTNKINSIEIGGRNLIRTSYIVNRGCSTFTYDKATNTWTCVAPKGSDGWGHGFTISSGKKIPVERGRTFIVSLEVNPSVDCTWNNDVNNWYNGTSGNDNDDTSKRANSSRSLKANTWAKCWFSYTAKNNVSYDLVDASSNWGIVTTSLSGDVSFKIRNIKGEYGTKPSDWTPAPEDIQASIDLKASKTDVYTKSEVYTKGQTDSAIKVAKDEITLGVSNTYETKSNVESKISTATTSTLTSAKSYADTKKTEAVNSAVSTAKSYADTKKAEAISSASTDATNKVNSAKNELNNTINSITVGGRNLFLKSDIDKYNKGNWTNNGSGVSSVEGTYIDGTKTIKIVGGEGISYNSYIKLKRNTAYTYSMMMKSSGAISMSNTSPLHMWLNTTTSAAHLETIVSKGDSLPANTWTKVWIVFKTPNTQDVYYMKPFVYGIGSNTVHICKVKVEEGNKATDWSPAPEDVQASIDSKANSSDVYTKSETYTKAQTDSAIKVAKDEINLGVSNTYETKTTVTSKISSAKTEAINSAVNTSKSYADTKKAEAISSASADATSKVNSAKTELNNSINNKANKSDVYTKSEVYTKAQTDSQIKVAKDEINLGVSNTYETKSNVENRITTAVNNIQIGGRNYIVSSKANSYSPYNTITTKQVGYIKSAWNPSWANSYFTLNIEGFVPKKTVYTLSGVVKVNGAIPSTNYFTGHASTYGSGLVRNEYDSKTGKFVITQSYDGASSWIFHGTTIRKGGSSDVVELFNLKFEEGNKATDWTQAPEEIEAVINTKANASEVYTKGQTDSAIKVAKDSIANTVSSTYLNKSDASNTYATKSSLTQTTDKIVADFKASGGYNLIKNSKAKNGTAYWLNNGGGIRSEADATFDKCFYTQAPSGLRYSEAIRLKNNTEYVYEGYVYSRNAISGNSSTPLHYWCNTTATGSGSPQLSVLDYRQAVTTVNKWTKCYVHFRTASTGNVYFTPFIYVGGSTKFDLWVTELSLSESSIESKWTPHPDEVYNGSTVIDANGVTINNGALTVKNKSGTTVLSGDSNGNLILNGTAKSQSGDMWVGLDSGGITFQDYHKNEQMLRAGISHFSSNRDLNGVTFAMPQCADFIRFSHISKLDLTNGWTSSDTQYHFMDIWSSDQNTGDKDVKKGINVYSPIYMNRGIKLYSGTTTWADISGTMSWSNKYGTVWNILGMYGDNGAVLGYKSGDSLQARFLVSEASHPGTGDNLISWGNYNFNGYTFHNANISANYLTVSGSKNCLQKTNNYGSRLINAYETAEYYFGDLGFGEINADGECFVSLDDIFLECVNTDAQYHVFTQVYEGAIKSIERHKTYFIVKGEPNTSFSWELKAKRIGYENNRLDVQEIDTSALETGLELFTDDDYKVNTSEEALLSTLTFDLNEILLTEE